MSLAALTDLRQFHENHVGQFRLGVIGNADPDFVAVALNPFVTLGVKQIVWNVHDFL